MRQKMSMNRSEQTKKPTIANELKHMQTRSIDIDYIKVHHSWHAFIKYCESMGFGEIEILKIQNGLPVMAEVVKRKVKFL